MSRPNLLIYDVLCVSPVPAEVEFNVSGMFAMPIPASNHNNHLDYDCGTIERKRPGSMVGPDNDAARKDK